MKSVYKRKKSLLILVLVVMLLITLSSSFALTMQGTTYPVYTFFINGMPSVVWTDGKMAYAYVDGKLFMGSYEEVEDSLFLGLMHDEDDEVHYLDVVIHDDKEGYVWSVVDKNTGKQKVVAQHNVSLLLGITHKMAEKEHFQPLDYKRVKLPFDGLILFNHTNEYSYNVADRSNPIKGGNIAPLVDMRIWGDYVGMGTSIAHKHVIKILPFISHEPAHSHIKRSGFVFAVDGKQIIDTVRRAYQSSLPSGYRITSISYDMLPILKKASIDIYMTDFSGEKLSIGWRESLVGSDAFHFNPMQKKAWFSSHAEYLSALLSLVQAPSTEIDVAIKAAQALLGTAAPNIFASCWTFPEYGKVAHLNMSYPTYGTKGPDVQTTSFHSIDDILRIDRAPTYAQYFPIYGEHIFNMFDDNGKVVVHIRGNMLVAVSGTVHYKDSYGKEDYKVWHLELSVPVSLDYLITDYEE